MKAVVRGSTTDAFALVGSVVMVGSVVAVAVIVAVGVDQVHAPVRFIEIRTSLLLLLWLWRLMVHAVPAGIATHVRSANGAGRR